MQHELGTNSQKSATIRDDSRDFLSALTTVIKKPIHAWGCGGDQFQNEHSSFVSCRIDLAA